jgi:hypothetical protein
MKKILAIIAGLAIAGAGLSQVDTTRPMVTGHGNVQARPAKVIVTHQTAPTPGPAAASSDEAIKLDKFVVTGSLLPHPAAKAVHRK